MEKNSVIKEYRGRLSVEQVVIGMNAAAHNARRLLEDAKRLFDAGSYPTACSLATLSIEESGKLTVLRAISVAADDQTLKTVWRDYRSHRAKNVMSMFPELVANGARKLSDFRMIFDPKSDRSIVVDVIKQLGFYTDCYENGHWSEPYRVIDEELARGTILTAEILLPKQETCAREIELWREHLGKVWGTPAMHHGLIEFFRAMVAEGLTNRSAKEIADFLGLPPSSEML